MVVVIPHGAAQTADQVKSAKWTEFEKSVQPFLAKHCFACHGEKGPEFDTRLDLIKDETTLRKSIDTLEKVQEMLNTRAMPPKKRTQPTEEELRPILAWLEATTEPTAQGRAIRAG